MIHFIVTYLSNYNLCGVDANCGQGFYTTGPSSTDFVPIQKIKVTIAFSFQITKIYIFIIFMCVSWMSFKTLHVFFGVLGGLGGA